jgi:hypothetical protein
MLPAAAGQDPRRRRRSRSSAAALPPPTSEGSQPWPELGDLRDMYNSVGQRTRVRQHANPLRADLQVKKNKK